MKVTEPPSFYFDSSLAVLGTDDPHKRSLMTFDGSPRTGPVLMNRGFLKQPFDSLKVRPTEISVQKGHSYSHLQTKKTMIGMQECNIFSLNPEYFGPLVQRDNSAERPSMCPFHTFLEFRRPSDVSVLIKIVARCLPTRVIVVETRGLLHRRQPALKPCTSLARRISERQFVNNHGGFAENCPSK
jgi:hypothetical protein